MEKLKIAFFSWESVHTVRVGGLAPATTHLAEHLAEHHEVHFFTRGEGEFSWEGVHYHCCSPVGDDIVSYCSDMGRRLLSSFRENDSPRFDILHFHDWHFADAMAELAPRLMILSFHSTEYGRNGGNFGDWPLFTIISQKEKNAASLAARITTVSQETLTEVMWLYGVPEWKITVVPNGTDPDAFRLVLDPGTVKKEYGIHPLAPVVLFLGRLEYQKGPDLLIRAIPSIIARRWDVRFLFAGTGSMQATLSAMAHSMPVAYLGYVSDTERQRLLNSCDLVANPSRNEPIGLVLTEAWSAERCVVATDVGGLAENIETFVDGIKVPVRPDAIAWGISYVIEDPVRMQEMGRAGQKKVAARFSWGRVTRRMAGLYRQVLDEQAGPHG